MAGIIRPGGGSTGGVMPGAPPPPTDANGQPYFVPGQSYTLAGGAGYTAPTDGSTWGAFGVPIHAADAPTPGAPSASGAAAPVASAGADVAPPPASLTALSEPNAPNSAGSAGDASPASTAPLGGGGGPGSSEGWGQLPMTGLLIPGGRSVPASTTALAQIGTQRGRIY
jgi:hypothetical protein